VFDPNVIASSILDAILSAVNLIVVYIPWWLWLIIILLGALRVTTRKKSKGGR